MLAALGVVVAEATTGVSWCAVSWPLGLGCCLPRWAWSSRPLPACPGALAMDHRVQGLGSRVVLLICRSFHVLGSYSSEEGLPGTVVGMPSLVRAERGACTLAWPDRFGSCAQTLCRGTSLCRVSVFTVKPNGASNSCPRLWHSCQLRLTRSAPWTSVKPLPQGSTAQA